MPRAGLTPDRVVELAAEVADRDGLAALSLAAVAEAAGVRVPSLYKHVDGLPDLVARLGAGAGVELAGTCRAAAAGRAGREALLAVAAAHRRYARRHPGRYAAADPAAPLPTLVEVARGYGASGQADAVGAALLAQLIGMQALASELDESAQLAALDLLELGLAARIAGDRGRPGLRLPGLPRWPGWPG